MTEINLYSTIIETTRTLIVVLDVDGRIVMFNNACERATGYRFEEVKGRHVWDFLLLPEETAAEKATFNNLAGGQFPNTHANFWITKAGERRWIEWANSAVMDERGRVVHVIGTGVDVTRRREAEARARETEERYRELARAIPLVLWVMDPASGRVPYVSPGFERIWGRALPDADTALEVFRNSIHPDDQEAMFRQLQEETESGGLRESEYRIVRPDGEVRWIRSHAIPVKDHHGKIGRIVGYAEDITDRNRTEQALYAAQQRERALLDSIPDAAWLKDVAGRYLAVNRAFRKRFGDDFPDPAGRTNRDIFPAETAAKQTAEDQEVIRTRVPLRLERQMRIGAGDERWIEVIKVPIIDESGDVIGITGVAHDVTERKLAEAQRIARNAAQRDALVKEVHHRIKNNLQGVITLIQQLATGHPESTSTLDAAITRLNTIATVHGLYGTTGERELRLEQIILRLVSSLKNLHGHLPLQLSVSSPISVRLSENEIVPLALIVNELIMNAIKHSRAAADGVPVEIALEGFGNGARIVIRNSSGRLPKHFNFDAEAGLGTGLSLVKSLLPPEGARLRFENRADPAGAEVELTLIPPVIMPSASTAPSPAATRKAAVDAHLDR